MMLRPILKDLAGPVRARRLAALLAIPALIAAAPTYADPPPAPANTVEGVTVEGKGNPAAIRAQVRAFVDRVTVKVWGESLMRWGDPVCPLVAGLPKDQGEFILARFTAVARDAGARLAAADCKPNVYVVVTPEPEALLRRWRKRDGNLFGNALPGPVARFIVADRPVRVWRNWSYRPTDGSAMTHDSGEMFGAPVLNHPKDSRLMTNVSKATWGALAVVDVNRIAGVSVGQLADYIAMSSLAEVRTDLPPGGPPSILRLFDGDPSAAPAGLTEWDRAYLSGLYHSDNEVILQHAQVADRMVRTLAH
jgi:hypothetical protein